MAIVIKVRSGEACAARAFPALNQFKGKMIIIKLPKIQNSSKSLPKVHGRWAGSICLVAKSLMTGVAA